MQTPMVSIYDVGDYDGQVRQAAELLRAGKVVVLPTETVYGAAGMLREPAARERLRALRPAAAEGEPTIAHPLIPHLADRHGAAAFLGPISDLGRRMMKKLWPGPVALIFDVPAERRAEVAASLGVTEADLYDNGSITLRCPDHFLAADVIGAAGGPIVAVRAGVSAAQPALRAQQVAEELDGKVDLILDAGPTKYSKPSTVIRVGGGGGVVGVGGDGKGYEIVRAGVYDERIIERLLKTTLLFVCTGNTCRSPMAEAIARGVLARKLNVGEAELEKKGISVLSAGSTAMPGARAAVEAADAVRGLGGDLSHHRSRPLTVELIHQADLIFAMSQAHLQTVRALVPSAAEKVSTLAPGRDIDDPIGGSADLYRELAGELQSLIEERLKGTALP